MMNWNKLLTTQRLGSKQPKNTSVLEDRSQFQRDYDRLIFSSPFRRMQNKTQVFPLPEHIFVHNRLTHSLEVATVGRSLGSLVANELTKNYPKNELISEIGTIVSAACLAHDLGNPPFGHSGEKAISNYFANGKGETYEDKLNDNCKWKDFTEFDGNANAFRLLTHQFAGKRQGGFALTYSTLASIVKYPFEAVNSPKTQKFGFFQSDKNTYKTIAEQLEIPTLNNHPYQFKRHPLVYLVEAADDICYQIMDMEDAYKLGIISYDTIRAMFLDFYHPQEDAERLKSIKKTLDRVSDKNEQISYLRSGIIGKLIYQCKDIFLANHDAILEGNFAGNLIKQLPTHQNKAMKAVQKLSVTQIYNTQMVVEIEIAGFTIIETLLDIFVLAIVNPDKDYNKKILSLMPNQYLPQENTLYTQLLSAVDFIAGMTDVYALDLYRKIKGLNLPKVV